MATSSFEPEPLQLEHDVDPRTVVQKINKHIVPCLFMVGFLCYLDRTNLSFGALELNKDLNFNCSVYGFGAGIFFVGYSVFQVPLTSGCERFGAPTWLAGVSLVWGLLTAALATVRGPASFFVLRLLLGVAESSTYPTIWYLISLFLTPSEMSVAYGRISSCATVAQVAGAPLAAAILHLSGVWGLAGWQWLFVFAGSITVVYACLLRSILPGCPRLAMFLTPAERQWLVARQAHVVEGEASKKTSKLAATLAIAKDWRVLYLALTWLLSASAMFGIMFWAPLLISALVHNPSGQPPSPPPPVPGVPLSSPAVEAAYCGEGRASSPEASSIIALLTMVPYGAAALSSVLVAYHSDRVGERRLHAAIPLLAGGAFLGATPFVKASLGPAAAFACLVLAAGATWGFQGPFFTWPAEFLKGSSGAGAFALINSVGSFGGFVGPYVIGVLTERRSGEFTVPMLFMGALLLAAGIATALFPVPDRPVALEVQHFVLDGEEGAGEVDGLLDNQPTDVFQRQTSVIERRPGSAQSLRGPSVPEPK